MLRNYLITALRNLVRNRLYAAINIAGLALGFAAALLIALYVRDEFSYDRFFPDYQHIYLLGCEVTIPGRAIQHPDMSPPEFAPLLKIEFPEVQSIARLVPETVSVRRGDLDNTEHVTWADPSVFDIFKFRVVAGNLAGALANSNDIVITRKIARKYFGRDNPVGETLEFGITTDDLIGGAGRAMKREGFRVTAVIADLPSNTNLDIDILTSGQNANSAITRLEAMAREQNGWGIQPFTYMKFPSAAAADQVQGRLADFMKRHKPGVTTPGNELYAQLVLHPIASLHLSPGDFVQKPRGNINTVYAMAAIGVLIVFAAGINFVNLMTARATRRAIEVGVRKATGAERGHLIAQFIGEAMIYACIGMGLGIGLAALALPGLNTFLDRTIELGFLTDIRSLGFVVVFALLVGFLGGAYPAFVLASFRPATVLKGTTMQHGGSSRIRQGLVVLQFAVLIGLLTAASVVYRQTRFAFNEAKRLNTDQVVTIWGEPQCRGSFKDGLTAISGVQDVACGGNVRYMGLQIGSAHTQNGASIAMAEFSVDYGFFAFYGLNPIAGRFFSEDHPGDAMPATQTAPMLGAVVLNAAAVRRLGFASPQDAIGKTTILDNMNAPSEIIGVVPDFAVDAVHQAVPPIVYFIPYMGRDELNIRIDGAQVPETLAAIDKLWKQVGPPRPIDRQFLDQSIAALYEDITRQETLFAVFAGVAIAIAVLGLFGMSASISERRTKEIGVRKAMGATRSDVARLLVWQFTKPVIWANLIAWPAGYVLMRRWLEGFAYHIDLQPWMFLAASALALVIAVATVIGHALLVARAKPVAALRYE